jgi:RES domain-containing protein
LKMIEDAWASSCKSVVLRIPSVIVPSESNFLLNPAHPDFDKLAIGEPLRFRLDPRLI